MVKGYQERVRLCKESSGLDHNVLVLVDSTQEEYSGLCGMIELSMQPASGQTAPAIPTPLEAKQRALHMKPYISNLVVSPLVRRRGFAQRLVRACEARAVAWGFAEVRLHVDMEEIAATQLYSKLGYETISDQAALVKLFSGVQLRYMNKNLRISKACNAAAGEK